jgi:UDP-glucose 4-epimerase
MLLAAARDEASGKVYNVGGCEVVSLHDVANLLVKLNGTGSFESRAFPVERKRIDIGDYYADDTRLRTELGWIPRVNLETGLALTVSYYRDNLLRYL